MTNLSVRNTLALPRVRRRLGRLPVTLSAIALIVAVVTMSSSTLLAQGAQACALKRHACHHAVRSAACCSDHANDAGNQVGPVESRIQLRVALSQLPPALAGGMFADSSRTGLRIRTTPPSVSPPDFTTRFAPLLI